MVRIAERVATALGWRSQWLWLVGARRPVMISGLVGLVLGLALQFVLPNKYTATLVLEPWQGDNPQLSGNLAAIASKFGIQPNVENSPLDFFTIVLQSDTLLRTLLTTPLNAPFPDSAGWKTETLLQYYKVDAPVTAKALSKAVLRLNDDLDVNSDIPSGTIKVDLTIKDRWLVLPATRELVTLANQYLVQLGSETHRAERLFLQAQVQRSAQALDATEDSLQAFYDRNRTYSQSSLLKVEEDRLTRRISLAEQEYLTLGGQLSDAQLAEARNTPVLAMADPGVLPPPPGLARKALNGVLFGVLAILCWGGWTYLKSLPLPQEG